MSSLGFLIPPLNREVQEKYMIMFTVEENPDTGEPGPTKTTPLRWILNTIERKLLFDAITKGIAEKKSDFEASCPVYCEDYVKPGGVAISGPGKASRLINEKPLKLYCGHVLGHKCFHRMINLQGKGNHKCPLCRCHIHSLHSSTPLFQSDFPLILTNGVGNLFGGLSSAIKLFISVNLTEPETHEALYEWVHRPVFEHLASVEQTREEVLYIAVVRWAVNEWCRAMKSGHTAVDTL